MRRAAIIEISPPRSVPSERSFGTFLKISSFRNFCILLILTIIFFVNWKQWSFLLNTAVILDGIHQFASPVVISIVKSLHYFYFAIQDLPFYLSCLIFYFSIRPNLRLHLLNLFFILFYFLFYLGWFFVIFSLNFFPQLIILLFQLLHSFQLLLYFPIFLLHTFKVFIFHLNLSSIFVSSGCLLNILTLLFCLNWGLIRGIYSWATFAILIWVLAYRIQTDLLFENPSQAES